MRRIQEQIIAEVAGATRRPDLGRQVPASHEHYLYHLAQIPAAYAKWEPRPTCSWCWNGILLRGDSEQNPKVLTSDGYFIRPGGPLPDRSAIGPTPPGTRTWTGCPSEKVRRASGRSAGTCTGVDIWFLKRLGMLEVDRPQVKSRRICPGASRPPVDRDLGRRSVGGLSGSASAGGAGGGAVSKLRAADRAAGSERIQEQIIVGGEVEARAAGHECTRTVLRGGRTPKAGGRELDGALDEYPDCGAIDVGKGSSHLVLEHYLNAWLPIPSFAGPEYDGGEEGSPTGRDAGTG